MNAAENTATDQDIDDLGRGDGVEKYELGRYAARHGLTVDRHPTTVGFRVLRDGLEVFSGTYAQVLSYLQGLGAEEKTARFVKGATSPSGASRRLYEMKPPLERHRFVVLSAVNVFGSGPEVLIFPSRHDGTIMTMRELNGSKRGTLDHLEVLADLGYAEVVP